jgi:tRNA modification GTPase
VDNPSHAHSDALSALDVDTIAAVASPPGRGGIGVVRISGPRAMAILNAIAGRVPPARRAALAQFRDACGRPIDRGLALYFPGPASYTGDDVAELHGHGGPVVMDLLLAAALEAGARVARPGEFTERAFLNGRLDLAQAEAVADLIASATASAARSAARSLTGEFSARVELLKQALTSIRISVEAGIDFPEDDVDELAPGALLGRIDALAVELDALVGGAAQGVLRNEGLTLAIVGRPNAGKSSLLNRLAGADRAIVTPLPGTTRDVLTERIDLGGIPVRIADTAGLRVAQDPIESEGVRRARLEIAAADGVLLVADATVREDPATLIREERLALGRVIVVWNKVDLVDADCALPRVDVRAVRISALTGAGFDELIAEIKRAAGVRDDEGGFSARRRHVDALTRTRAHVERARSALRDGAALELAAEDLRAAQRALGEILGEVSSDELLGAIFSSFCIGK